MSFEFTDMIKRYAREQPDITVTRKTSQIVGGRVTTTTEIYTISDVAIFTPKPKDVEYYQGLQYINQGIKLYEPEILTAIRQSDDVEVSFKLQKNDKVKWKNKDYEISEPADRTTHSDFNIHMAIKVVVD